jgi:pimeloyl-ACP methyl ester carboxylesterase
MQPLFEHRLELAGYSTRALELEGDGPPLILFHGFADSADTWRRVLALLGRRDRRALALDLPGFGAADPLDEGPVLPQFDAFVAAALGHVAEEHGQPAIVAGNSLGGVVALRAGERHPPDVLAGIVPIAPAGLDMPTWFQVIERDPVIRFVLQAPVPLPEFAVRTAVGEAYRQLAFAKPRGVAGEVVRTFTDHHRNRRSVLRFLQNGRRVLPELAAPFALDRIACPVLLVWGDRDRMVSHRGAQRVVEALPDTTYELLEGVGHCPQVEVPERVVALLDAFTAATAGRG